MRNILSNANRAVLQQFAWSNCLLAFDYDGTLAPIVPVPADALIGTTTRRLLEKVTKLYPCIVISGRSRADVLPRLAGLGIQAAVGNHGAEPWQTSHRFIDDVRRWHAPLVEGLAPFRGVIVEDKAYSIAVHYRRSREKKKARAAILDIAASLGDVRLIGGKQVVNILPKTAPHKGMALERERDRFRCDTALYVGDDETDEDVFALDQPGRLLTIRVGAKRNSLAAYYLPQQRHIDQLLRALLLLRPADERQGGVR